MARLSLYLENEKMDALRKKAALANTSLSKYVVKLIDDDATGGWPDGYWDLFGSIEDETFCEPKELSFAATARACGATLVTNNVREFERVPGLRVESWAVVELD